MTGAEFLRKIYELEDGLACKEDEIQKIHQDMIHLKSVDTARDRVDGGQPLSMADKVAKLMEVEEALNRDWDELIKWREVARKMIGRMPTEQNKAVLMTRVVNHRAWKKVAAVINKSEDYARHLYPVAVAEFEALAATDYPGYLDTVEVRVSTTQKNYE